MAKSGRKQGSSDTRGSNAELQQLVDEVAGTKRLLILLLAKLGSNSKEIAMALGVGDSTIRNMMSFRKVQRIADRQRDDE